MSAVRFLCDEHVGFALVRSLLKKEPGIDVLRIGQSAAPPLGTTNSALLLMVEADGRLLLTRDRRTMPQHVAEHLAAGRHTWGVFILRDGFSVGRLSEELLLVWSTSEAEEWRDQLEFIPWG
ncbi:MAG: DUF5615 family PIN-like protein [Planctomycetes bacterium]|nr:DUF5615 family PIN-like protein [Planctomycetota bacterium]